MLLYIQTMLKKKNKVSPVKVNITQGNKVILFTSISPQNFELFEDATSIQISFNKKHDETIQNYPEKEE